MALRYKLFKYLGGGLALLGLLYSASQEAWAIAHPTNYRVNHVIGPDATAETDDDDDPNYDAGDPNAVLPKAQAETTITVVRTADGLADRIFGAWVDESWNDHAGYSSAESIGFALSADVHGADQWPTYDLARSDDGYFQPGHMPPPYCGEADPNRPPRWFRAQVDPVAAAIPPNSGITSVHLVGLGGGSVAPYGCGQQRVFYAASRGHPDTWDPNDPNTWDVQTIAYGPALRLDKPYVSIWGSSGDPNDPPGTPRYVCITWTRIQTGVELDTAYLLECAISTDGGDTFAIRETLDRQVGGAAGNGVATFSASAFAPGPGAGDDPHLYVVWWKYGEAEDLDRIVYRRGLVSDPNQGAPTVTWDPPLGSNPDDPNAPGLVADINHLTIDGITPQQLVNFRVIDQPSIAVDHTCAREGWVYVCYASEVPGGLADPHPDTACDPNTCQPDIFVSRYRFDQSPNTVVWDEPVRVNDDDVRLAADPNRPMRTVQVMPWVALDDLGHVGVGFYDRRMDAPEDPNDQEYNKLQWYYFAYSSNGAGTFRPNMVVSDPNRPSDTYPDGGLEVFVGDYTSIAGANASFFGLWCDTRNWHPDRPGENGRLGDIYFAEIEVPAGDGVGPDFDADCDVDLDDFGVFAACYNGANRPPAPSCPEGVDSDFDADGDVDLDDFAILSNCYTGTSGGCPWQQGDSAQGGMGGGAPEGDAPDDPTVEELYRRLEDYCEENDIPFT